MQRYRARMKSRAQMAHDIPVAHRGWWFDFAPGRTLTVRNAERADIEFAGLRHEQPRDPALYVCEATSQGALILRAAIERLADLAEHEAVAA